MNHKKLMLAVLIGIAGLALSAKAEGTPDRLSLTNSLGAVGWTNTESASAFSLEKIKVQGILPADSTSVWKRVTREGFTNTIIAAQVGASGAFEITLTNAQLFLKGDMLVGSGVGTNSGARNQVEGTRTP